MLSRPFRKTFEDLKQNIIMPLNRCTDGAEKEHKWVKIPSRNGNVNRDATGAELLLAGALNSVEKLPPHVE